MEETTVIGTYLHTIHRNIATGYSVFTISCKGFDDKKEKGKIVCKGIVPIITRGVPLKINGHFVERDESWFFVVSDVELYSNQEEITIEYIVNSNIKGIGPKTAEKIVSATGADIFSFIKQEDAVEKLCKLTEFPKQKVEKIIETIKETFFEKDVYDFIRQYGGSYADAQNIYLSFGKSSIKALKETPYEIRKVVDISFNVCDAIAKDNNVFPFSESRLRSIIIYAMYEWGQKGHTYATLKDICMQVNNIVENSAFPEHKIPSVVVVYILDKLKKTVLTNTVGAETRFILKEYDEAENIIAQKLVLLQNSKKQYQINVAQCIKDLEHKHNITYSEQQKESFHFLLSSGVKILTGGPGTGKSTVIRGLVETFIKHHPNAKVSLCAPTGRAAQNLKDTSGHPASTIHRLLNIQPFEKDGETFDVTALDSDLIIVDEISMVDTKTFAYLCNAIKTDATLILCGDSFQLPSVGAGNVLHDLIDTKIFEQTNLNVIYRQKEQSKIVDFAQSIKQGNISKFLKNKETKEMTINGNPLMVTTYFQSKDLQLVEVKTANDIFNLITKTAQSSFLNKKSKHYVENILDFQILSSTKKEIAGTKELNKAVQSFYIQEAPEKGIAIGDKVMMIENNYEIGYCNGDIGIVKSIDISKNSVTIDINGDDVVIDGTSLKDLALSYACTIHKSQGSEYDFVIISLPKEPISILQRNLLYTAVTRAKKYVAVIFEEDALTTAVRRNDVLKRKTLLKDKIIKQFKI